MRTPRFPRQIEDRLSRLQALTPRLVSSNGPTSTPRRRPNDSMEAAVDAVFEAHQQVAAGVAAGEEPEGAYRWVSLYELDGDDAVPVPAQWLDGPRDERYGFHPDTGEYGRRLPGTSG